MIATTTHVIPRNGRWTVKKSGAVVRDVGEYATQKQAVDVALAISRRVPAGQVSIHGRDGSIRTVNRHGLPKLQRPPHRGKVSEAIEKAVSSAIRARLLAE